MIGSSVKNDLIEIVNNLKGRKVVGFQSIDCKVCLCELAFRQGYTIAFVVLLAIATHRHLFLWYSEGTENAVHSGSPGVEVPTLVVIDPDKAACSYTVVMPFLELGKVLLYAPVIGIIHQAGMSVADTSEIPTAHTVYVTCPTVVALNHDTVNGIGTRGTNLGT